MGNSWTFIPLTAMQIMNPSFLQWVLTFWLFSNFGISTKQIGETSSPSPGTYQKDPKKTQLFMIPNASNQYIYIYSIHCSSWTRYARRSWKICVFWSFIHKANTSPLKIPVVGVDQGQLITRLIPWMPRAAWGFSYWMDLSEEKFTFWLQRLLDTTKTMKNKCLGHLKTRLFTIKTSKNIGLGGPWWI